MPFGFRAVGFVALMLPPALFAQGFPETFADVAKTIKPSVVNINTEKDIRAGDMFGMENGGQMDPYFRDFFDRFFGGMPQQNYKQDSLGSGFLVDAEKGYVLTNNHVVDKADKIQVKLFDGREFTGKVVGTDPQTDLAVIRLMDAPSGLVAAKLGNSSAAQVGDWVVAVGSPFGLEETVSHGIISAKGRVIGEGPYDDFLQTDAPINPGNSGGPLVDLKGEVIGINTAISTQSGGSEGIGFAIPIDMARDVYEQLTTRGKVVRGWLGVSIQELTPDLAQHFRVPQGQKGVVVADVMDGGPADKAGLKDGDVLTEFGSAPISDVRQLQRVVAETGVGSRVPAKVWRDGAFKTLSVEVGRKKDDSGEEEGSQGGEVDRPRLGLLVKPAPKGVEVEQVEPDSPADDAGLQPGDLILEVGNDKILSPAQFKHLVDRLKPSQTVVLQVSRDGHNLYIGLKMPDRK